MTLDQKLPDPAVRASAASVNAATREIAISAPTEQVAAGQAVDCVPGSIESKAVAFDQLKALMNPDAVLFGLTLLQGGVLRSWFAKRLIALETGLAFLLPTAVVVAGWRRADGW